MFKCLILLDSVEEHRNIIYIGRSHINIAKQEITCLFYLCLTSLNSIRTSMRLRIQRMSIRICWMLLTASWTAVSCFPHLRWVERSYCALWLTSKERCSVRGKSRMEIYRPKNPRVIKTKVHELYIHGMYPVRQSDGCIKSIWRRKDRMCSLTYSITSLMDIKQELLHCPKTKLKH